ncbi:MAG TPA: hypothetical protein VE954_04860 [Oligoflexus sp.]|uniref:hypothetical protein n=1 Tax=Oligoflexus sp. TaxID=1971216 RepID=UPI002D70E592|nr:hypothetical protein [Oligoflexus sp.]HYX32422.1 hypothetical protein [Oligoflexus sp.]
MALVPSLAKGVAMATAISLRSSVTATGKGIHELKIPRPTGVVSGDLLLARIANRNQVEATIQAPEGWMLLRSDQSASQLKSWILWKVAGNEEPASYSFSLSIASHAAGSILALQGVDPIQPIDTANGQKNGNIATLMAPPLTTSTEQGFAVWFGTQIWTGASCPEISIGPPSDFIEAFDTCLASTSTGLLFNAAYRPLGAAGPQAAWNGSSPFPTTNTTQVVALKPVGLSQCSRVDSFASTVTKVGTLTSPDIVEVSGLAASRINPGVLYAHSENNANFVAINQTNAAILGTYVAGVIPWDWEDIATGPCPIGHCLYMGDIGRSSGHPPPQPTTFAIYRMKEPNLSAGETNGTLQGDRFPFVYPDQPANAETLMVHPTTGEIYVVTKEDASGLSRAYKFPQPLPAPDTLSTLIPVAQLQMPLGPDGNFRAVTSGSIHPCANRFLLRTYRAVYEYRAPDGGNFESAFTVPPIALTDTAEGQGEAIAYDANGSGYFTMSERESSPYTLKRVDRL